MSKKIPSLKVSDYQTLVDLAIQEDIGKGDITSKTVNLPNEKTEAMLVSRESGVLSGIPVAQYVLKKIAPKCKMTIFLKDGSALTKGSKIARIKGTTNELLTAERIMLNFLQHLSGIASITAQYVSKTKGTKACILDTRKTTPAYRKLEKYAVACGGGQNHRMGLFDMVMIKDNHIASLSQSSAEPIKEAIKRAKKKIPKNMKIIVEVDNLKQLKEALPANPNIILLDNMSNADLKKAVSLRDKTNPKILLEASGGVNLNTVRSIAQTGVDRISVGSITHSVKALDIGLDI